MGTLKQKLLDAIEASGVDLDVEDGYTEEYLELIGQCMKFQRGQEVVYPIPKLDLSDVDITTGDGLTITTEPPST